MTFLLWTEFAVLTSFLKEPSVNSINLSARDRFSRAERNGLRIAILCRTLVVVVAVIWMIGVFAFTDYLPRIWGLIALSVFIVIGITHFFVIGTRYDRWWLKYCIYAIDILAVCSFFVLIPISQVADLPQIIAFRAYGIYFLFPIVALSALSLSWQLVVWSGTVAVIGWWSAFYWVVSKMTTTLSWADMPQNATLQHYKEIFLSVDFIGRGNRVQETALLYTAAIILAVVVYRARRVFFAQIAAEAEQQKERKKRQEITETFGRFVPAEIVDEIIDVAGVVAPKTAFGTALLLDISGFTKFSASRSPTEVINKLNEFLAWAADVIGKRKGVVISFTGDGLLATFNTPLELRDFQENCFLAADELCNEATHHGFSVRIGIASGQIASGCVGSDNRTAFTVYGETINLAARLEALCKTMDVGMLFDSATALALKQNHQIKSVGKHKIRGFAEAIEVFKVS